MTSHDNDRGRPIVITMGDPAGIGPEVLAKCLADGSLVEQGLVLVGAEWSLQQGASAAGVALPAYRCVEAPSGSAQIELVDVGITRPDGFCMGQVDRLAGEVAVRAVELAADWCLAGEVAAMVTCPINKAAIHAAGYVDDLGHQEILARKTGSEWTATMLMTPGLKVAHLSTHLSLIEAARYVTKDTLVTKLRLLGDTLGRWGMPDARIAVAALNPHGGESGILGREEIDEIAPAVAVLQAEGRTVAGPIPADSIFYRAIDGEFDVVLALYHDQGHIAIKVHNFHESTTATLGIPIVRTSVDHGTAFDIAGRGVADPRGLRAAVAAAQAIVQGRLQDW